MRIGSQDSDGRCALAESILRSPFSQEMRRDQAKTGTLISRATRHPVLKRNFEVGSALDWLAALTAHIPNAGEHLMRYSGWHSNVSRGKRWPAQGEEPTTIEQFREVSNSAANRAWARRSAELAEAGSRRSRKRTRSSIPGRRDHSASPPSSSSPR